MTDYIVTGGTGFLGRNVLPLLLERDPLAEIHVLVRQASVAKLEELAKHWPGSDRVHPLVGDLAEPGLGLDGTPPNADHIVHLGAIYDMTAGDEQSTTNVEGTRAVVELARRLDATLHHVSSIAVSGDYAGDYGESDFDLGQGFPTPYHRTKFEAEKLVRTAEGLRWRVYRPAVVVGNSVTGEMNKIDGPYYFFPSFEALGKLPSRAPMTVPKLGATNIVPVDYVAAAMVELILRPGLDGRAFHLVNPRPQPIGEIYSALAKAAGAPRFIAPAPAFLARPFLESKSNRAIVNARTFILRQLGIPESVLDNFILHTVFTTKETEETLRSSGLRVPELGSYAPNLWKYWAANLDPNRARRAHPDGELVGRHIIITGASSGIGRASAIAAAQKGAVLFLLARRIDELEEVVAEIRADGGQAFAYQCDITEQEGVDQTVKSILDEHDHIDMLVNNAGRSIRRAVHRSTDRMHDFERTMAVNYFGAVRITLALLPQMRERRFGHIVNISSAGVQTSTPRFAAYVASKAALDKFAEVTGAEMRSDGISFTTIHMPLVQTPMITPTQGLNAAPAASAKWAAATVVRALTERPLRIDVPFGTLAEYGNLVTPRLTQALMHQFYRSFPDSPAAKGLSESEAPKLPPMPQAFRPRSGKARPVRRGAAKVARRLGRWVPGTQW